MSVPMQLAFPVLSWHTIIHWATWCTTADVISQLTGQRKCLTHYAVKQWDYNNNNHTATYRINTIIYCLWDKQILFSKGCGYRNDQHNCKVGIISSTDKSRCQWPWWHEYSTTVHSPVRAICCCSKLDNWWLDNEGMVSSSSSYPVLVFKLLRLSRTTG